MISATGTRVDTEVMVSNGSRPADLLLHHWKGGGPAAVDVSVTHPLCPSLPYHRLQNGHDSANKVESEKHTHYDSQCSADHIKFFPFVLTTFGSMGSETARLFSEIITLHYPSDSTPKEQDKIYHQYQSQLQVRLKRDIARMLLQGYLPPSGELEEQPSIHLTELSNSRAQYEGDENTRLAEILEAVEISHGGLSHSLVIPISETESVSRSGPSEDMDTTQ